MKSIQTAIVAALCAAAAMTPTHFARATDIIDIANPPAALQPSRPLLLPGTFRVEGGVGYANGGSDATVSSPGIGSVSTNLLGGGGIAAEAALWYDGALDSFPDFSLGAQYLYFGNSGTLSAASSAGPILGLTSATANLNLTTNAMMLDLAWRPSVAGFHPFVGTGIGVAFNTLSASALGFSTSGSQTSVAGQVFLGFDWDLTPNIYVGLTGRFFVTEPTYHATTLGVANSIDITDRPISLMAHVGMKF